MTQEEKALLLKDLSARLPYNVMGSEIFDNKIWGLPELLLIVNVEEEKVECSDSLPYSIENFRPYLRSLSSMTKEEEKEYAKIIVESQDCSYENNESATTIVNDWYLSKGFDVRGLISKGLAIEAPDNMYK